MAVAAAVVAANVHYAQPMLPVMAAQFGVGVGSMGLLPAVTQIGFILGLMLLVPLGDVLERRRLVVLTVAAVALALAATAFAPNLPVLMVSGFAVGILTIAPQLLVPFAAVLAPAGAAGRASSLVLSGVLLGVLLSKVVAGVVTAAVGWRVLYAGAAVLMVVCAVVLRLRLPVSRTAGARLGYGALLGSLARMLRVGALRIRMLSGALAGAAFMVFWTTYAAHLDAEFGLGPLAAAGVAVAGIAGALASPFGGRAADAGHLRRALLIGAVLMLAAPLLFWWGHASVFVIVVGAVLLDAGTGLSHAANQAAALALDPSSRGRLNSLYVTGYFAGAALGSVAAGVAHGAGGWTAVCLLGIAIAVAALLVAALPPRLRPSSPEKNQHRSTNRK
ncbi:MFS transporter [Nakamurella leprariae]|uniref:MFS transporter n=1 Tax=Nakamurella leprariae TaxID=2803911 RepID=A0A939C0J6_9ACTN|nr:MFS transporter [Nakamurella leprariae]MBM9469300.1 MFS transporter [Nakamurella leprariae]